MQKELSPVQGKDTPIVPATQARKPEQLRKPESYHISSSSDTLALAKDLARFIKENKLFHSIQGKEFVNVEGWQYAGSRLGILPVVATLNKDFAMNEEIKYSAKVNLIDLRTGHVVGCGFALCSSKEPGKRGFQEFAIASMAQTRAIGKAYRSILAWIIRAAGYEATPAEEMEAPLPVQLEPEAVKEYAFDFATADQKEAILKCLGADCFSESDRNSIRANLEKISRDRATQMLENMKAHIKKQYIQI